MISLSDVNILDEITPDLFMQKYKKRELPVVMKNLTKEWKATQKWSLEYFEGLAGDKEIKLYGTKSSRNKRSLYGEQTTMPLKEYFKLLRTGEKDLRMFFFEILKEIPTLKDDFLFPEIGLKFLKKLPTMFFGGKGAKVQMYFDIDYADIFLCHFGGKKKVMLFSPQQTPLMYHVPYSFSSLYDVDYATPDYDKYPALKHLQGYETTLQHGDVLYIPPGWWHYIEYEEIGYSMALRALPRRPKNVFNMLKNVFWIRKVETFMRKRYGEKWTDKNESLAVINANKNIDYL